MLKRIEMKGFKSFAEKTVIDFGAGVTCIVGPNGSGKSNITDAFRWVLGEQSYKSLRGSKMQDVIFNGTASRAQHGYCEVSVLFDNKEKLIKTDFDEIAISRKLFRSGLSEYRINGSLCRLKDIRDLFTDTGIGVEGYSIIGQGRIDQLLSSAKEDRRLIFEEASGIVKYKNKKEEAARKLERTASHIERIDDIIAELETRLEPLKEASQNAAKYLELKSALKGVEISLYLEEIEKIKAELEAYNQELGRHEAKSEAIVEKLFEYKEKEKKLSGIMDGMLKLKEELKSKKDAMEKKRLEKQYGLKSLKDKLDLSNQNKIRLTDNISKNRLLLDQLKQDLEQKQLLVAERQEECEVKNLRNAEVRANFDEKNTLLKELENRYFLQLADKRAKQKDLDELKIERAALSAKKDHVLSLIKETELAVKEVAGSQDQNLQSLREASTSLNSLEARQAELLNQKQALEHEVQGLMKAQEQKESDIYSLNTELGEARHRAELLDKNITNYETSSEAVQALMRIADRSEVYGTIASLISVDETYEKAMDAFLAARMENVVVSTYDKAAQYIDYLREERVGRVTFMPLDTLKANPRLEVQNVRGLIGHALDFVRCEDRVEPAIRYLLFNVFISANLEEAKKAQEDLPLSAKIVTLAGDVVNVGGTVSGGSAKKQRVSALAIKREYEETLLKTKKLEEELNSKKSSREEDIEGLRSLADAMKEKQEELDENKASLINAKLLLAQAESKMADTSKYEAEKKTKLSNYIMEDAALKERLNLLDEQEEELAQSFGLNSEHEDELKAEIERYRAEIEALQAKISAEEIELLESNYALKSAEKEAQDLDLRQKRHHEEGELLSYSLSIEENTEKELERALFMAEEELQSLSSSLNQLSEEVHRVSVRLDDLKLESRGEIEAYRKLEEELSSLKDEMYAIKINTAKLETRYDNEVAGLWQDYEMGIEGAKEFRVEIDLKEAKKQVRSYKSAIAELGDVNLSSMKEYAEVSDRYEFMSKQKDDLKESLKKLNGIITEMDLIMRTTFTECLADINQKFAVAFKDLFKGGHASIELQEGVDVLESEIIIHAMPPGKRLQSLELLSGGEKALTAIAIMFSILKTKPAPFCILDEIEAALDDRNIALFSAYLKKYSSESQFIVITHRKGTMEMADSIYGITMKEKGVSDTLSLKFSEEENSLLSVG